jgi:DNA-binding transcriptional regulator YdaS (Cro superfamily)
MATTMRVYESSDNGQVACEEHRPMYGRIPWREMSAIEQAAFRAGLADIIKPRDSLCEVCRGNARRAKAEATR